MTVQDILVKYALQFVGVPYKFGGSNPMDGIDCSGLINELYMAIGILPYGTRLSSGQLMEHFQGDGEIGNMEPGALAFYGPSEHAIDHVAMFIGGHLCIEAAGGSASTTTLAAAEQKNAFVKVRPHLYRRDFIKSVMPKDLLSSS